MTTTKIVHPKIVERARSYMERAGGDPNAAGPLAEWAADAQDAFRADPDKAIRRGVLVGRDGTLVATVHKTNKGLAGHGYYVDRLLIDADPEQTRRVEGGELSMNLRVIEKVAGQQVIEVRFFDVCTDHGQGWVEPRERMDEAELRARREYLGLTTEALAIALHVHRDTPRKWEAGKEPIAFRVAGELAVIEAHTADIVDMLRERPDQQRWLDTDEKARQAGERDWCTARWWRHCVIRARA